MQQEDDINLKMQGRIFLIRSWIILWCMSPN